MDRTTATNTLTQRELDRQLRRIEAMLAEGRAGEADEAVKDLRIDHDLPVEIRGRRVYVGPHSALPTR